MKGSVFIMGEIDKWHINDSRFSSKKEELIKKYPNCKFKTIVETEREIEALIINPTIKDYRRAIRKDLEASDFVFCYFTNNTNLEEGMLYPYSEDLLKLCLSTHDEQ